MQSSQPTLEPHSLCYTCWVQVCTHSCLFSTFFPLGYATAAQFLPTRGSLLSTTRTTRTSRRSSPSRRPCGALLSFGEFCSYLYFASTVSDISVINVINNFRIRFIISYSWYVLWYTVHSIVYTCDLILARIWLLGLCSFINRVLQCSCFLRSSATSAGA